MKIKPERKTELLIADEEDETRYYCLLIEILISIHKFMCART